MGAGVIVDALDELNWIAAGAATLAAFAIGLAWFAPPTLGGLWARQVARYTGIPEAEITSGASQGAVLGRWLASIAGNAIVLAFVVEQVGARSPGDGVVLGLALGLGLGATLSSWPTIFARMPRAWWLLNNGAFLLMQMTMGAILGAWQ